MKVSSNPTLSAIFYAFLPQPVKQTKEKSTKFTMANQYGKINPTSYEELHKRQERRKEFDRWKLFANEDGHASPDIPRLR